MVDFRSLMVTLAELGIWDIVLPFMLIFTIVYATLTTTLKAMFGRGGKGDDAYDHRKFATIVALVIAFGVVIPHATNSYPPGKDVVEIINTSLPQVALIAVAIIGVMIILGMFGISTLGFHEGGISTIIVFVAMGIIIYIFGSAAGWGWQIPPWLSFLDDPDVQTLIVAILVFGIVVKIITGSDKEKSQKRTLTESMKNIKDALFGK